MKVSVSLPDEDVAFLDSYAQSRGDSRSAALHKAVRLLREQFLGADYGSAWDEWEQSDAQDWEAVVGDGVARHAPR